MYFEYAHDACRDGAGQQEADGCQGYVLSHWWGRGGAR